ncbi:DarT ssDNA thymidine ADP-ribosyltransferase family protein [Sulfitobacter sp. F26204]|uniref:DarT ssDNA thymidine ADP-ribosyltransferase family protein n=1 Tax=Sulfitobacter sp. F26204 TaxID=2996014 RepID=UPI00225E4BAE|nr:DarT ssDNA thymidine ADP-ribosyltransferase family protein [Sulfitobacter sp. F26204]MCX7558543.1 DarT ssDNA thymidine ADP-ribosyltransferase family protein [Sulfitobacter sp. F26204]
MTALDVFVLEMEKQRRSSWFYHFTAADNVPGILTDGLLSKQILDSLEVPYLGSGSQQSRTSDFQSGVNDYVSLSFTPDHPMQQAVKRENRVGPMKTIKVHPYVVVLDEVVFCEGMANAKDAEFWKLPDAIKKGLIDFEALYDESASVSAERLDKVTKYELLVLNCIPPKFLQR